MTFLKLELKPLNGTITGGMSVGNIEVDKQGALRRVDESPRDLKPIFDVTQRASTLTFSRKDSRDSAPDRFELRLLETGRAELQFLLSDAVREELAESDIPSRGRFNSRSDSPASGVFGFIRSAPMDRDSIVRVGAEQGQSRKRERGIP